MIWFWNTTCFGCFDFWFSLKLGCYLSYLQVVSVIFATGLWHEDCYLSYLDYLIGFLIHSCFAYRIVFTNAYFLLHLDEILNSVAISSVAINFVFLFCICLIHILFVLSKSCIQFCDLDWIIVVFLVKHLVFITLWSTWIIFCSLLIFFRNLVLSAACIDEFSFHKWSSTLKLFMQYLH